MNTFPKIIHQIWLQGEDQIPEYFIKYSDIWKNLHPDYKYMFWDAVSIEELILKEYPEYINYWLNNQEHLHRSDYGRIFILHKYGGIYTDFDSYPLKSINGLFDETEFDYTKGNNFSMLSSQKNINEYNIILPTRESISTKFNLPSINNSTIISKSNCDIWIDFLKICPNFKNEIKSTNLYSLFSYFYYIMNNREILNKVMIIPFTYLNSQFVNKEFNQYIIHRYTNFRRK